MNHLYSSMRLLAALALGTATSVTASADPIDATQARQIASALSAQGDGQVTLVAQATRNEAKSRNLSASTRATSPYYIYSRGEDKGFVIVSGDDCLPQVLGYTESGSWDEASQIPNLQSWLAGYATLVEDAQASGQNTSRQSANAPRRAAGTADIDVLLTCHWHQSWPYNSHCPTLTSNGNTAATGCVATATAQVGYYFRKDLPDELQTSTPTYSYGDAPVTRSVPKGTPMKWDLMLDNYNSSHPSEYDDVVGEYVFATGAATWLTYGSSTSGQTSNVVNTYSSCFAIDSKGADKSGYSQSAWESLVYKNLKEGRPMVYSGVHDSNGGHCIVLDGYRASTNLFHFNFGWGGQGDGWYTLDDETGVNGFHSYQYMVYDITPRKQNLSASIALDHGLYVNHDNAVTISVTNNGTLAYSGLYLFLSTSNSTPSALSSARASDTSTSLPADGQAVSLSLEVRPSVARSYYLILTDKKLNVLSTLEVEATDCRNDLRLNSLSVLGSERTETAEGETYTVVDGTRAVVMANVENRSDASYEGTPRLLIEASTDGGATFTEVGNKYADRTVIAAGESGNFIFDITNTTSCPIDTATLYRATLTHPLATGSDAYVSYAEGQDSVARFILHQAEADLTATRTADTLRFSGCWNASRYLNLCTRTSNSAATIYDLTEVTGVGQVPPIEGSTAITYVAANSAGQGQNVVRMGDQPSASDLVLEMGKNFTPLTPFTAQRARLTLHATPGEWFLLTVPFAVSLPDGIVAKQIDTHTSSGINNRTSLVRDLEAGHTYLAMISSDRVTTLEATNVDVAYTPQANADTAIVGTFTNVTPPDGALVPNQATTQYFDTPADGYVASAFTGWFYDSTSSRTFRANSSLTLDPAYLELAQAISQAYDILDLNSDSSDPTLLAQLTDSLAAADHLFALRTLTTGSSVRSCADRLLALADTCSHTVRKGLNAQKDMTSYIVNPSFEESATSSTTGSTWGWTLESTAARAVANSNVYYRGAGADGNYILYSCNSTDSTGVGISQTLTGLTPGLYSLSAMVGGAPGATVTLYANSQTAPTATHSYGQYYLTEATVDSIVVLSDTQLTIGIKAGQWYKADDFRLTYLRALTPEEDPVAINGVTTDSASRAQLSDAIYDLTGRRLKAAPAHGLYIEVSGGVARKIYRK